MKIKIGILAVLMLAGTITTFAQGGGMGGGGGMQQRTPEERSKRVVDTLTTLFKLDAAAATSVQTVFVDYNKASDKMRQDMQAGGGQFDRSAFEKLTTDRDEKLKKVLSADQFKKYKDEIEPAMRPRRGGQGGGGGQGGARNGK